MNKYPDSMRLCNFSSFSNFVICSLTQGFILRATLSWPVLTLAGQWHCYMAVALFKCVPIFLTFYFWLVVIILVWTSRVTIKVYLVKFDTTLMSLCSIFNSDFVFASFWRSEAAMLTLLITWTISTLPLRQLGFSLERLQHCQNIAPSITNM